MEVKPTYDGLTFNFQPYGGVKAICINRNWLG